MSNRNISGDPSSAEFDAVVQALSAVRLRPEVRLTEVPAPSRIAPYAIAMTAEVVPTHGDLDEELASGRFVLLHDPDRPEPWEGTWRIVTFARAELEPETATDPMLGAVGWSWLTDSLSTAGAEYVADAGTVTRVVSESFAGLGDRPSSVEIEVRASWTPVDDDITSHLHAWGALLCTVAGLEPLPDGVVALPGQRR
ncbi:DUF3000 domain-containing protein [Luteipulveratus sp. YIM 133132]|uniref:DUF3000 domain-containing protein n=1 Tax=Luteipulveratus flavus TaxID=3031728 RepID=UPI0023B02B62|nr:DUF3000 domain-containing protein [Luteipulveratus sp. YIM 133132]MDE9366825.1 DUF3000 domain-containing protein [Luteipulveratus sp. YIM 133132]